MTVSYNGLAVDWLGYATARVETTDGTVVYVDPGRYGVLDGYRPEDGDLVLVTHVHHYDPDGIRRVAGEEASVLVFEAVHHSETDRDVTPVRDLSYDVRRVDAETDALVAGVVVRPVEAFNRPDGPHTRPDGSPVHPEGSGCGFVVDTDGGRVLVPGDTDLLEGHAKLDADLLLPPIGGTYTMDRHGAADLAERVDAELVVPVHYDTFEAIDADAGAFAADVAGRGIPVVLDEPG